MKILNYILRLIIGGLFVFSGIVKLIDPKGTQIKLEEYFTAFSRLGEHYIGDFMGSFFDLLIPSALFLSVGLSTLEVVLGIAILLWFRSKITLWTTVSLLVFFGFLTGYSSSCDPNNPLGVSCVTDCGCFGDFMKLEPIESFYKDLILLVLSIPLLFMAIKKMIPENEVKIKSYLTIGTTVLAISFGLMNIVNLPIIDFRPYEIGNDLIKLRTDGAPAKVAYVMAKDGREEVFDAYPYEGGYKFVRVDEIAPAEDPTAKDFYLYDYETGEDVTEEILQQDYSFIVIKDINETSKEDLKNIRTTLDVLLKKGENCAILTGNDLEHVATTLSLSDGVALFNLDETVIKAMVRNYPSLIRINKGIVKSKDMITKSFNQDLL